MDKVLKKYFAKIGAKGGSVSSEAKKKASSENGKRGGRPRKKKREKGFKDDTGVD
jgi:hypothetical protein